MVSTAIRLYSETLRIHSITNFNRPISVI
jgi:hypothetical protein